MAITTHDDTNQPATLSETEAAAFWAGIQLDLARWILGAIKRMGLPTAESLTLADPPKGYVRATSTWVKRRLVEDDRLLERIHRKVKHDFDVKVANGKVWQSSARGLLYRIATRTTWRLATQRAEALLHEAHATTDRDFAATVPSDHIGQELGAIERDLVTKIRAYVATLSHEDRALINERAAEDPRSYGDLAAEFGTTAEALRQRHTRLWDQIRTTLGVEPHKNRSTKGKRSRSDQAKRILT